ncbi:hypothetical protein VTH82DRAFT_3586 [Thermothelomyces myriococcoides]
MAERHRLGLERDRTPLEEEAPPYSPPNTAPDAKPEPPHPSVQPTTSHSRGKDSAGTTLCCRHCVCTRCGSRLIECPAVPELDDTGIETFTKRKVDSRKRQFQPNGGCHTL